MVTSLALDSRQLRDRERLRWKVLREWRLAKRFDYSEAELNSEVDRRFEALQVLRQQMPSQLELPLERDDQATSRETKRLAVYNTRPQRINRKAAILKLLKAAGQRGLTRSELAARLSCRESDLCSPVLSLIREGKAAQPSKRPGPSGLLQAVVTLQEFTNV